MVLTEQLVLRERGLVCSYKMDVIINLSSVKLCKSTTYLVYALATAVQSNSLLLLPHLSLLLSVFLSASSMLLQYIPLISQKFSPILSVGFFFLKEQV